MVRRGYEEEKPFVLCVISLTLQNVLIRSLPCFTFGGVVVEYILNHTLAT
jgi:hypothetical protein